MKIFDSFRANRVLIRESEITANELELMNEDILSAIRAESMDSLRERLDAITVDEIESPQGLKLALQILNENGIVVVPNYLSRENAEQIAVEIMSAYESEVSNLTQESVETPRSLVQVGSPILTDFEMRASYKKPVIQCRQAQDTGMVDIFNVDKLIGQHGEKLRTLFNRYELKSLITEKDSAVNGATLNCYINQGVTSTRGFHVDSYSKRLKAFVYLTDVDELASGPYTYVLGSHLETPYRKINKIIASHLPKRTETPIVSPSDVVPILGLKGALVVSDQSGMHRGWPQEENAQRIVAVMNYTENRK